MPGTVTPQAAACGEVRNQIWRALQALWTLCCVPGTKMPVGMYGVMKATLEKMEADAQCMLGVRYATRMTLRKVARGMVFALEWMGYYRKRKHNQYHQKTKGIVRHVFGR